MAAAEEPARKKRRRRKKTKKENQCGGEEVTEHEVTNEEPVLEECHEVSNNDDDDDDKNRDSNVDQTETQEAQDVAGEEGEEKQTSEKPKRKRKRKRKKKEEGTDEAAGVTPAEKKIAESVEHTVYVEGIPFDCTGQDVKSFFESHGCSDVVEMRLPRWQDSGRLRGYGHVVFGSGASREKALKELNGKNLGKRYLTIQAAKTPRNAATTTVAATTVRPQPKGCATVFCKNLPYHATEEDIEQVFSKHGKIVQGGVRIARNYQTRHSKGFCYIEFKNPEGAYAAVQQQLNRGGLRVLDRTVYVDYDEGQMKGSYKTHEGRLWSREYKDNNNNRSHHHSRSKR